MRVIHSSAPGRICLFGEHQDYLGLPVIPMAINLRVEIEASARNDNLFIIELPDIKQKQIIEFNNAELVYTKKRDYFRSCMNVLFRRGYTWKQGWNCVVRGNIPINSGTSSSSALNNAWCKFLIESSDQGNKSISNQEIAGINYLAEVVEFKEAGGMMDQYSTAIGKTLFMEFNPVLKITGIKADLGYFVLGDSGEAKDTQKILAQTKAPAFSAMEKIYALDKSCDFQNIALDELEEHKDHLSELEYIVMIGMIENRELTYLGFEELQKTSISFDYIGHLLNRHHYYLDKHLQISTPKINKMIEVALKAGAKGAKINGSGGGGCMFAYAPENPEQVADEIRKLEAKAYIIKVSEGLKNY